MHKNVKLLGIIVVIAIFLCGFAVFQYNSHSLNIFEPTKTVKVKSSKKVPKKKEKKFLLYKDPSDIEKEGTWKKKSEKKTQPNLATVKDLWIRVSLKGNRTYIMSGNKPIYTMLSTAGRFNKSGKSDTPVGTYHIEAEKGQAFFNQKLGEGALNYVSWHKHGIYLFHSVPTKKDKSINVKEANKLGKTAASHGCVRLSIPDSKWLMNNVPYGTKVVIKKY